MKLLMYFPYYYNLPLEKGNGSSFVQNWMPLIYLYKCFVANLVKIDQMTLEEKIKMRKLITTMLLLQK